MKLYRGLLIFIILIFCIFINSVPAKAISEAGRFALINELDSTIIPVINGNSAEEAIKKALHEYEVSYGGNIDYSLQDIRIEGDFAVTAASQINPTTKDEELEFLTLLAKRQSTGLWEAIAPKIVSVEYYNSFLLSFPNELIDEASKAYIYQYDEHLKGSYFSGYKLPWQNARTAILTNKGGTGHEYQLDFVISNNDVYAAKPGTVVYVKEISYTNCTNKYPDPCWQKANMVIISHGMSEYSWYVHLAYNSVIVNVGDNVSFGQKIGTQGNTGYAIGTHLHFMTSTGHSTWTHDTEIDPNFAPWGTGIYGVNFSEVSYDSLSVGSTYTSQNIGNSTCPTVSGQVKLFDSKNCGGSSYTLTSTGLFSLASSFNDKADAIAIPSGWSTRLYKDDSESSPSKCFSSSDSDFSDNSFSDGSSVANQASMARVYNNSDCSSGEPLPSGYTYCGLEREYCDIDGAAYVIYGASGSYTDPGYFVDGVWCNNENFEDPLQGTRKSCYKKELLPSGYSYCSLERDFCSFDGSASVMYGANGSYTSARSFTNGVWCTNAVFGDPIQTIRKSCFRKGGSTGTDQAQFIAQSTYPTVKLGQSYQIYFEVKNTGGTLWKTDDYWLQNIQNPLGANVKLTLSQEVEPGEVYRWTISQTAPTSIGAYRSQWMISHKGTTFGPNMFIDVFVVNEGGCSEPTADQAVLYMGKDFSNGCVVLGQGNYPEPLAMGFPNDDVSSIKVGSGVKVVVCKDSNYLGGCEGFYKNDTDLSDNSIGDNQVSSVKIGIRDIPPDSPSNVGASDGRYAYQVTVNWEVIGSATSYEVYRNTTNSSTNLTSLGTVVTPPFSDKTGVAGKVYWYFIKSCNSYGCSDYSLPNSGYRTGILPIIKAPVGTITNQTPTYRWTKIANATQYQFAVFNGSSTSPTYEYIVPATSCTTSVCTMKPTIKLSFSTYRWHVQAFIGATWKPWSAYKYFTIARSALPE